MVRENRREPKLNNKDPSKTPDYTVGVSEGRGILFFIKSEELFTIHTMNCSLQPYTGTNLPLSPSTLEPPAAAAVVVVSPTLVGGALGCKQVQQVSLMALSVTLGVFADMRDTVAVEEEVDESLTPPQMEHWVQEEEEVLGEPEAEKTQQGSHR